MLTKFYFKKFSIRILGDTMPKRSPAKRDFRHNGETKIKKSKEGASSSTSNVDEDLVRTFCLFYVMSPLRFSGMKKAFNSRGS